MKGILTYIFLLVVFLNYAQPVDKYKKITDSLLERKQYDELIHYLDGELKLNPKDEFILRNLGFVHISKNNLDVGEKYYRDALDLNQSCAYCYFHIGRVYVLRNNYEKGLEYIEKAISIEPNDALLYSLRGRLKEMMGDKFGSLFDHNKSIELDSLNSEYYIQRGTFNSNRGYSTLAISDFNRAIKLSPNNYLPYFRRASVYYEQDKIDKAIEDINKAIELDSNQYTAYTGRGTIYYDLNEFEKAVDDYTKAISMGHADYLPYLNRALAYYKLEDLDAACEDYSILSKMIDSGEIVEARVIEEVNVTKNNICDSLKASYYYQRGIAYFNLKEYQKAIEMYTKVNEIFPESVMILSFKGNAYKALNEYEKALEIYYLSLQKKESLLSELRLDNRFEDASEETINNLYNGFIASVNFGIVECKTKLNLFNEALVEINNAIEITSSIEGFSKEEYYNMRGFIYLNLGDFEKARLDFDSSIELNRDYVLAYLNRAFALICMVEKVELISHLSSGELNGQFLMNFDWVVPKSSIKKSEPAVLLAISDCNKAIQIDKNNGSAYYIKAKIKKAFYSDDYCDDLIFAKKLGFELEINALKNCNK